MAKRQVGLDVLFEAEGYVKGTGEYMYKKETKVIFQDIPMPNKVLNRRVIDSYFSEWLNQNFKIASKYRWVFKHRGYNLWL